MQINQAISITKALSVRQRKVRCFFAYVQNQIKRELGNFRNQLESVNNDSE